MTHLDELPGGELIDLMLKEVITESNRIYSDQAFFVERRLQDAPAPCQMQRADLLSGIEAMLLVIKADGTELAMKRESRTIGTRGRPERPDITINEFIGRLTRNARVEIKRQREKREPKHDEQFAADNHDPDQVEA